ncbi:hypothetical protein AVEN_16378-1 [Araneus ventricosus]|uniref:Endonuclease/exonuclease/phosphatase domain-containing protein n=1 Tax=Araneus ventricosus TaxID=182803 RepID=A0A4Y2WDN2_ARAVE|nr:hypothetical protein AVEN_16378-1 [Araneus ventricosus]
MLIQQTHLRAADKCYFPNYTFYSTPSRTGYRMRGTGIIIKSNIPHYPISNPYLYYVEATMLMVNYNDLPPINFISVYNPPNNSCQFTMDFESLIAYNSITFIAGDLNAKHRHWNCARANNLGNQLHNFAIHAKMRIIAPDHSTCYTRFSESVIDLAITRNFNYPTTAESLVELGSDHLPVRFHVETGTNPSVYDKQKFTPNWKKYQEYLLLADSPSSPPLQKRK